MIGLMIRCSILEPFPKNLSQPIVTKGKTPLAQRDISRFMLRLPQFVTKDFQGLTKPQKAPCNIEVTLSGDSRGRPRSTPATFIIPCRPIVTSQPPTGPDWAHELKHDRYGCRSIFATGGCGSTQ